MLTPHAVTEGTLLGGRIGYRQFRDFHRTGLEPVLMAAAVPALAGEHVLEAGCGAAAGLLCLAARVPGVAGTGIEQDPDMAVLARHNLSNSDLDWPVLAMPIGQYRDPGRLFDHAFANPPWHRAAASRSPDGRRDLARRAPDGMLADWTGSLAACLRSGGTLTLALPAALHARAASALLDRGFGAITLMPFWPRVGVRARIVLVQATLHSQGDAILLPGMALHDPSGGFTQEAQAVLRDGGALAF